MYLLSSPNHQTSPPLCSPMGARHPHSKKTHGTGLRQGEEDGAEDQSVDEQGLWTHAIESLLSKADASDDGRRVFRTAVRRRAYFPEGSCIRPHTRLRVTLGVCAGYFPPVPW
jgi:hypothetical protein